MFANREAQHVIKDIDVRNSSNPNTIITAAAFPLSIVVNTRLDGKLENSLSSLNYSVRIARLLYRAESINSG